MALYLDEKTVYNIPKGLLPMPVLSDNLRNFFSFGIKAHTKGFYSHFMWLIEPGILASQQPGGFKKVKLSSYLKQHRLKFFFFPNWSIEQRDAVLTAINHDLALPWWKRRYDYFSYLGHLTGLRWIQGPWTEVCSDKIKYMCITEPEANCRKFPNPKDVNKFLMNHPTTMIYGRYIPD